MRSEYRIRRILVLIALLVWAPALLLAKVTGNISGTVRDAQGAVVPGVTVTAKETLTGVEQTLQTDSVGFYNFPALAVGVYELNFQKSGFTAYQEQNLKIDVDTALRVDVVLQVGGVTQEISVTAAAAQVNTETTQTGEVVESPR